MHVEARGQLLGVGALLLLPCESWGPNSGGRAWQQAPLPAEPSRCPGLSLIVILVFALRATEVLAGFFLMLDIKY